MKNLTNYEALFWDFDGVILDSVPIRDEGYWHTLKHYPKDQVEKLIHYQQLNGGISRYVKFRYFYEEILDKEISDEQVNRYAKSFSEYMIERLTDKNLIIDETIRFIENHHESIPMHIVSGSDQEELRYLCKELEIDHFFNSIHGSPTPKIELVKQVLAREKYHPEHAALIGDSINDYDAARLNGLTFFGYNNPDLKDKVENYIHEYH
jgi:HAD superfamily hydrolase (TIGR01549 family)